MDAEERWERIEGKIEFLVDRQARLEARTDTLHEEVDRIVRVQSGLQDLVEVLFVAQQTNEKRFAALAESQEALAESQKTLVESQKTMAESQKTLTDSQKSLSESQKETGDRVNALIQIMDELIRRPPLQ